MQRHFESKFLETDSDQPSLGQKNIFIYSAMAKEQVPIVSRVPGVHSKEVEQVSEKQGNSGLSDPKVFGCLFACLALVNASEMYTDPTQVSVKQGLILSSGVGEEKIFLSTSFGHGKMWVCSYKQLCWNHTVLENKTNI